MNCADESLAFTLYLINVEDADKEGNPFILCGGEDIGHLIAVRPIESDKFVAADLG